MDKIVLPVYSDCAYRVAENVFGKKYAVTRADDNAVVVNAPVGYCSRNAFRTADVRAALARSIKSKVKNEELSWSRAADDKLDGIPVTEYYMLYEFMLERKGVEDRYLDGVVAEFVGKPLCPIDAECVAASLDGFRDMLDELNRDIELLEKDALAKFGEIEREWGERRDAVERDDTLKRLRRFVPFAESLLEEFGEHGIDLVSHLGEAELDKLKNAINDGRRYARDLWPGDDDYPDVLNGYYYTLNMREMLDGGDLRALIDAAKKLLKTLDGKEAA